MSCVAICLLILAGLWIVGYNLITVEKPSKDVAEPRYG
jgi:hypothetical protein